MASLSHDCATSSVTPSAFVGADRFWPFEFRLGRKTVKRFGVLFTCLNLRVIHIEVASSLKTDSFINALRRFIARIGQSKEMCSKEMVEPL